MKNNCEKLHKLVNSLPLFRFPYDEEKIPLNGLYVFFEKREHAHEGNRIVRVGTHTGKDQLRSRLKQHLLTENKDRSIFRKNIGRCYLNKSHDPFLEQWNWRLTSRKSKEKYAHRIDLSKQKQVEEQTSKYLQNNFSFVVLRIDDKKIRLEIESKMISTISRCDDCQPSQNWLGLYSPKQKIQESGLWLVQGLYKEPLDAEDFRRLEKFKT